MRLRILCVAICGAAFAFALSQPPAPGATRQGTQQQQGASQVDQQAPTTTTNQLPAGKTNQPEQRTSDYHLREWVFGFITIGIGWLQWQVMKGQKGVSEEQSRIATKQNEIISTQTTHMEAGLRVAQETANAAKMSALASIKTFESMDRPWLAVNIKVLQQPRLTVGQPLAIHFKLIISNVGGSAAQHVIFRVGILADEQLVDPVSEVTQIGQSMPIDNIRGHVILPGGELAREFVLHTEVLTKYGVTPTIFGVVRYTHGRATDGTGIPSPKYHTTAFGFVVKAKDNIGGMLNNDDGSQTQIWDAVVETSVKDFHHAD